MRHFTDHTDDEGYRASLYSDDEEVLIAFADWLTEHGIGFNHNVVAAPELEDFTVWTDWITDHRKAVLLKLTFGGAV